jgi:surface antigen
MRIALVPLLVLPLSACTLAPPAAGLDNIETGSIVRAAHPADSLAPSDREQIRAFVVAHIAGMAEGASLEWSNPDTGSTGTVSALAARAEKGASCRAFAVTVSDLRGVRGYRGDACRAQGGDWQLASLDPDDGALL